MTQQIEAVFENGVFRPLHPVHFSEHQRVTLHVPDLTAAEQCDQAPGRPAVVPNSAPADEDEENDLQIAYELLPPDDVRTIQVNFRFVGKGAPLSYPLSEDDLQALMEME